MYLKEIDRKCRPFSSSLAIAESLSVSMLPFFKPDIKQDDIVLVEERDFEPFATPLDSFQQNNKIQIIQVV